MEDCDYLFFRNFHPNLEKLEEKHTLKKGTLKISILRSEVDDIFLCVFRAALVCCSKPCTDIRRSWLTFFSEAFWFMQEKHFSLIPQKLIDPSKE